MNTNIKVAYKELVQFLETNKSKKISTILPQVLELVSNKQNAKTYITDDNGKVTHIYCYYHKKWEPIAKVAYGSKKHSSTGYNTMCKEGVNRWSLQQREYKKNISHLLDQAVANHWSAEEIAERKKAFEEVRTEIVARKDGIGFDSLNDISQTH